MMYSATIPERLAASRARRVGGKRLGPARGIGLVTARTGVRFEVSLLERLFGLVFKYRPVIYAQGELAFSPPWPAIVVVAAAVVAGARRRVGLPPRPARPEPRRGRARRCSAIRLSTVALLLVCLLRPVLVVRAVEPQRNVLAVLVDDSRSMTIADQDRQPRSAFVRDAVRRVRPPARGARPAVRAPRLPLLGDHRTCVDSRRRYVLPARARTSGRPCSARPKNWPGCRCPASCCVTDGADTSRASHGRHAAVAAVRRPARVRGRPRSRGARARRSARPRRSAARPCSRARRSSSTS